MRRIITTLATSIFPFLALTLVFTFICLSACNNNEPVFGIYLVDSGELVLSEHHIEAYYQDSHIIELNKEGIEKWNSYMTYEGIPKLKDTLYTVDFVVKLKDKEIYGGKFYSGASSASYSGVVILDALMKLDESRNTISINFGYGPVLDAGEDPRNNQEVLNYLDSQGLLK